MNLKEMCEIGYCCGLETIGEAFELVVHNSTSIFPLDEIAHIVHDLMVEAAEYEKDIRILDIFPEFKELGE